MDYSALHKHLRTLGASKYYDEREAEREALKGGLSKEKYWKTKVHSTDDAMRYYDLYYPEYPDYLKKALVLKIEKLVLECQSDDQLAAKYGNSALYISQEDIFDETLQRLAHETNKRMEFLTVEPSSQCCEVSQSVHTYYEGEGEGEELKNDSEQEEQITLPQLYRKVSTVEWRTVTSDNDDADDNNDTANDANEGRQQ